MYMSKVRRTIADLLYGGGALTYEATGYEFEKMYT
jgi:hypothetical protein